VAIELEVEGIKLTSMAGYSALAISSMMGSAKDYYNYV
jgi:hypothetical protein